MKNNKYCDDYRWKVTQLHHVVAKGSRVEMESVLRSGGHNLNSRDSAGQTPLFYAIFRGYKHGVNLLLRNRASVNVKDNDENTPLHFAVKRGNVAIVSNLLQKGADLEQRNNYGQTVLQYAIVWNYSKTFEPMVNILLVSGAKVSSADKDLETPLHSAAARKDSKIVCQLLIEKGADVNAIDKRGNTPLHIASMKQCKQAIVTLIDMGADIEARNNLGDTPIHIAVKSNVPESLKLLLDLKAQVNAKNSKDKTALHIAAKLGYVDAMKVLIDHGASLKVKDCKGNTALHCAAKGHYIDNTVGILLENGANFFSLSDANLFAFNDFHETPLDLSFKKGRSNVLGCQAILDWATSVNTKNYVHFPITYNSDQFETCMKHFIKLSCAKIPLDCDGYQLPWTNFLDKFDSCGREVEKMKANKFGRHSMYDVLINHSDPTFVMNEELIQAVTSPKLECKYPIYGSLLKVTLKKAVKRCELLNKAQSSLNIPFPSEIQREILVYLDEISLLNVIKAFQSQ